MDAPSNEHKRSPKNPVIQQDLSAPDPVIRLKNQAVAHNLRVANTLTNALAARPPNEPAVPPGKTALEPTVCETSAYFDILAGTSEMLPFADLKTTKGGRVDDKTPGESNAARFNFTKTRKANA